MLLHVDSDLGGDPDDVAALTYLLARPDVQVAAVTTVDDPGGRRAGLVEEVLRMAGRTDVPVAAGAQVSLTTGRQVGSVRTDRRYWPRDVAPRPGPLDAALDLLARSLGSGATVVAIGPATNLALLERASPGRLRSSHVVLMGGWLAAPDPDLPQWQAADDYNVTCDSLAAAEVRSAAGNLTVVPLAATGRVHLRDRDLPRLEAGGRLGGLMARQAAAYRDDEGKRDLARGHPGLPPDLANFHHDPLAAAVAAGWPGVTVETLLLRTAAEDPYARLERTAPEDPAGRTVDLVTGVDGAAFAEHWLTTVEALRHA